MFSHELPWFIDRDQWQSPNLAAAGAELLYNDFYCDLQQTPTHTTDAHFFNGIGIETTQAVSECRNYEIGQSIINSQYYKI